VQQSIKQELYQETLFGRYNHYYENEVLKLFTDIEPNAIGIQIENKLEKPFRIIWDSAKVITEYERIYKISKLMENFSNEFLDVQWQTKKDTILLSIKNKTKDKMEYEKDGGFVRIGDSFLYQISDIGFKNYTDKFINLGWSFSVNKIDMVLINISKMPFKVIEEESKICINNSKVYNLSHQDRRQNKLELPDSSDASFNDISILLNLQKADSLFVIRPTILLPKSVFSDAMIPLSNTIYPYLDNDNFTLTFSSRGFVNSKMNLILPIKIDEKIFRYNLPFRIKNFQILRKG